MYTQNVIPNLAEALQVDRESMPSEVQSSSVGEMILSWNEGLVRKEKDELIEPRRILARKLVEVGVEFSTPLDNVAKSTFETLAKELDVYGK